MVESAVRGGEERTHRTKFAMIFSAMRHYAESLRQLGWVVDYHRVSKTCDVAEAWDGHLMKFQPAGLMMMEPNSCWEEEMVRKVAGGLPVTFTPTCQFVLPREEFRKWAAGRKRLLMEHHYRTMRQRLQILTEQDGEPVGGAWNFDTENRKTVADWKKSGSPKPPRPLVRKPDPITEAAVRDIEREIPAAFGRVSGTLPPVTREEALAVLKDFISRRLVHFGDYQDLMLEDSPEMFHSLVSAPINLGLLDPMECVEAAVEAWRTGHAPLAAVEGFVRQIIGWREFVNGVYWFAMPDYTSSNALGANRPLPEFFYTGETDLHCLQRTLAEVHETGYNHHIQRLMVLGNFLLLAGIRPQEAYRWFLEMYVDAHDWVMAANVIGMALHADGGLMATKPYAGSGAYLSKMGNYCASCRYDPRKKSGPGACPFNLLYWDFYDRHADRFASNPRTSMMVNSWKKRPPKDRQIVLREAADFLSICGSKGAGE